jgi:hypothetical protein
MSFDLFVQACISLKRMTDVFKRYDDDRDGYITVSFEEFLTGEFGVEWNGVEWMVVVGMIADPCFYRDPPTAGVREVFSLFCSHVMSVWVFMHIAFVALGLSNLDSASYLPFYTLSSSPCFSVFQS